VAIERYPVTRQVLFRVTLTVTINIACLLEKWYLVWCPGQNKRITPLPFFHVAKAKVEKATKELTALTSEMDSNQMVMCLPPVTSAVFLIAK
jgi:hypothetical protein